MAGRGSRLRPQTLILPKPLIPIGGTPILHQLLKEVVKLINEPIKEIVFIVGDPLIFGDKIIKELKDLAKKYNSKPLIYRQLTPLGTGHAIMCAKKSLRGKALVIYPDTLIRIKKRFNQKFDGVIWTKEVKSPESYGVVKLNSKNEILDLVEKPLKFVSNQAVIGIYYFKEISKLKTQLERAITKNKINSGEFQINDGILAMIKNGKKFSSEKVTEWLDCGSVKKAIDANKRILAIMDQDEENLVSEKINLINSKIIPPCFLGDNIEIKNSKIGPYVSIGHHSKVLESKISNSIIQTNSKIKNANIENSMIGNNCNFDGKGNQINIGDYSELI